MKEVIGCAVIVTILALFIWNFFFRKKGSKRLSNPTLRKATPQILEKPKTVGEKIINICALQFGRNYYEIAPNMRFVEDLGADSLDYVEIVEEVEEEFGIVVPDEEVDRFKNVGDLIEFVQTRA